MVSVRLSDAECPFSGPGRWVMPTSLIEDKKLADTIQALGRDLEEGIKQCKGARRTHDQNPQLLLRDFKTRVCDAARIRAKKRFPALEAQIEALAADMDHALNRDYASPEDEADACRLAAQIRHRINDLEKKRSWKARTTTKAHCRLEGETVSKYWSLINKGRTARDVIFSLGRPGDVNFTTNAQNYETRSDKMAELTRDYHDDLQHEGL